MLARSECKTPRLRHHPEKRYYAGASTALYGGLRLPSREMKLYRTVLQWAHPFGQPFQERHSRLRRVFRTVADHHCFLDTAREHSYAIQAFHRSERPVWSILLEFDRNCDAADVIFYTLKNRHGPTNLSSPAGNWNIRIEFCWRIRTQKSNLKLTHTYVLEVVTLS